MTVCVCPWSNQGSYSLLVNTRVLCWIAQKAQPTVYPDTNTQPQSHLHSGRRAQGLRKIQNMSTDNGWKKIKIHASNIIIPLYIPRSIFSQRDIMGLPHHKPSGPHTTDFYFFSLYHQRSVLLHSHHIGSSRYIIDFLFKHKKTSQFFTA